MNKTQAIVLLIAAFFLLANGPAAMAADAPKAPTAEQLQAEYGQIQIQYQLVQSQRENLAYRERDLKARAQEIQDQYEKLELGRLMAKLKHKKVEPERGPSGGGDIPQP